MLFILSSQGRIFIFYKILVVKSYLVTWTDLIKLYHCLWTVCDVVVGHKREKRWEANEGPMTTKDETIIIIIIHSFYIALFSALEQTHCAHWHVIVNEWLYPFIARIINIHGSGVLVALCGCCMDGATWNAAVSAQVLCTPGYSVTSFKAT